MSPHLLAKCHSMALAKYFISCVYPDINSNICPSGKHFNVCLLRAACDTSWLRGDQNPTEDCGQRQAAVGSRAAGHGTSAWVRTLWGYHQWQQDNQGRGNERHTERLTTWHQRAETSRDIKEDPESGVTCDRVTAPDPCRARSGAREQNIQYHFIWNNEYEKLKNRSWIIGHFNPYKKNQNN